MIHIAVHKRNRGRLVFTEIQTSKEKPVALSHPILRLRHNQTNKILSQNAFHCNNLQDWFSCGI